MAAAKLFALILTAISVNSQQYAYPYPAESISQNVIPYYQPQQNGFWYPQPQQQNLEPHYAQPSYYPYPYVYGTTAEAMGQPQPVSTQAERNQAKRQSENPKPAVPKQTDPYANLPEEVIDVDPAEFRRIMHILNAQPKIVSYETRTKKGRIRRPNVVVTTDSKQSNQTALPTAYQHHQVTSKTYSFNKTFVIHPGQEKTSVVNLNFVNGVPVTDAPERMMEESTTTTTVSTTTTEGTTTTESDEPDDVNNWLN